jgi:pimeloyl-ACP methyl ester carboxylesterase
MTDEPLLVPVPGGRRVAVRHYGDPDGAPIFFYHGWPNGGAQGVVLDATARELNLRVLAIDRPGVGRSDVHVGRTLRDWPEVLAALADHFGAERFHVFGVSGGGPYALVSAWGLPERVKAAAVVSGAPPLADRTDVSTLMPAYRWMLAVYRRFPGLIKRAFRFARGPITQRPPLWFWKLMLRAIPPCDRRALDNPALLEQAWAGFASAWTGHEDGVFHDARIYAEPWGFDPATIRVPVRLWHGHEDRNFQISLAEELAARIPSCTARYLEDEGHYSLFMLRNREVLTDLLSL